MSYEQLLHDFVDGSLDYQGEMTLFTELQANDGLRRELKLLMLMRKAAQHDVKAFTPAPESHDAIFARLGFSPGLGDAAAPAYWGSGGGITQGIIGGIVGAIVMALIIFGAERWVPGFGSGRGERTADVSNERTSMARNAHTMAGTTEIPPATPHAVIAPQPAATPMAAAAISPARPSLPGRSSTESHGREITAELPAARPRTMFVEPIGAKPRLPATEGGAGDGALPSPMAKIQPPAISPLDDAARVSTIYRVIASRSFSRLPDALNTPSTALLADRAIALEYRLGVRERIGVEVGQESFYQRFNEVLPTGDILQHEQNPSLLWGGVSFTRLFRDGPGLQPYASALLGGTRVGPMGRLSMGAAYDFGSDFQLFAGGEMSALAYRFGGSWLLSPKYGITYGLSLRL